MKLERLFKRSANAGVGDENCKLYRLPLYYISKTKNYNYMKASRKTMHLGASAQIFKNAESLRNKTTLVEDLLWNHLRDRKFEGLKFRRQHPLKQYVSDFYCHELKLIIELDGLHHNKRHIEFSDNERSVALMNEGLHIIRFTNSASRFDIENSLTLLREKVKTLKALKGKRLNKRKII